MNRQQLEVVVNLCWRISGVDVIDFIEGLNNELRDFTFKYDMVGRILVFDC